MDNSYPFLTPCVPLLNPFVYPSCPFSTLMYFFSCPFWTLVARFWTPWLLYSYHLNLWVCFSCSFFKPSVNSGCPFSKTLCTLVSTLLWLTLWAPVYSSGPFSTLLCMSPLLTPPSCIHWLPLLNTWVLERESSLSSSVASSYKSNPTQLSIYLSISLPVCPSTYLSIYPSVWLLVHLSVCH